MFFRGPSFRTLALQILEEKKSKARNTQLAATIQLNRLIAHFGYKRPSQIREHDWQKYIESRLKKDPKCKLFDDRKYMRQVMLRAFNEGITPRKMQLRIPDCGRPPGREITHDERNRLFLNADGDLLFQMRVAWKMGLRLREMLKLRWSQIFWAEKVIRFGDGDTKTKKGREVPIPPALWPDFEERIYFLNLTPDPERSPYVFPSPTNSQRPQDSNKTAWKRCKQAAGVNCRWNDWRHTCATALVRAGVNEDLIVLYLGTSRKMLREVYQHLNIGDLWKVANAMRDG